MYQVEVEEEVEFHAEKLKRFLLTAPFLIFLKAVP